MRTHASPQERSVARRGGPSWARDLPKEYEDLRQPECSGGEGVVTVGPGTSNVAPGDAPEGGRG